jgi:hypothetical protein
MTQKLGPESPRERVSYWSCPEHSSFQAIFALIFLVLISGGCKKKEELAQIPATSSVSNTIPLSAAKKESLEEQEARFDSTVWRDEVLAQKYEKTFAKIWDDVRRATNKVAVLGEMDFDSILLPKVAAPASGLGLGIQKQTFQPVDDRRMPRKDWNDTLKQLYASGWRLKEVEWYHQKFSPPKDGKPAWSELAFEIFGERLSARTRFIMRGTLGVEWDAPSETRAFVRPSTLRVTELTVLERAGEPAFREEAIVTPNPPERFGEMINMHPIIITDINGDWKDDIIMAGMDKVLINDGTAKFTPSEFISEKVFRGSTPAGVLADFNGDGKLDFLTVAVQGALTNKLVLYPGNGDVPFTAEPMVAWADGKIVAPSVITAGDIDHDGDLDVWVGQYKPPYKGGQVPTPYYDANDGYSSYLLLNDGHGKFDHVTYERGLNPKRFRRTLAASFVDLDSDGDLDLVTVNDYAGVDLFYNDGTGHFKDETPRLYNRHGFGMGICFADFDHDGTLGFLMIGMSVPTVDRLEFMKLGREDFLDRTQKRTDMAYGNRAYVLRNNKWVQPSFGGQLAKTGWSWGTTALDFDNNGMTDIYVTNGHISGESAEDYDSHIWTHDIYVGSSEEDPKLLTYFDKPFRGINTGKSSSNGYQHNVLFMDTGTNEYVNVAYLMGVAHEIDSRAAASVDLNNDGKQDLVFTEGQWFGGPQTGRNRLHIEINQLDTGNHWIGVKLTGKPGCSTIGTKVSVITPSKTYLAQIVTGDSYQTQHPNTVHFGLGRETNVQAIRLIWPNGKTNVITQPKPDQYLRAEP